MRTTWYKSGQWNAICAVCGFKFKNTELSQRWDGLYVCRDDWEIRHPQEMIRPIPDQNQVPWTRPDADQTEVTGHKEFVGTTSGAVTGTVTVTSSATISSSDVGTLLDGTSSALIMVSVPIGVTATLTIDASVPSGTTIKISNSGTLTYTDNSTGTTLLISNFNGGTSSPA